MVRRAATCVGEDSEAIGHARAEHGGEHDRRDEGDLTRDPPAAADRALILGIVCWHGHPGS